MSDIGGVWRTIGGRRVFIKDGDNLETAMKKSGKFRKITTEKKEREKYELNKKLKEVQNKVDKLDEKLAEYEEDEMMANSPAHDELRWEYEEAKEKYDELKKQLNEIRLGEYEPKKEIKLNKK